jgi:hypothetical protein
VRVLSGSTEVRGLRPVDGTRKVVAVIGDVMIDRYLSGRVDRISPQAPIPVLLHGGDRIVAGGALNIFALGCDVRLVGLVGADLDGNSLRDTLNSFGVSAELLVADPVRPTISKTRVVSGRQQFVRIDREVSDALSEDVQKQIVKAAHSAIADADIVVLSDYAKGALSDNVLGLAIAAAKSAGKLVLVDPKRRTFEAYRGADRGTRTTAAFVPGRHARLEDFLVDELATFGFAIVSLINLPGDTPHLPEHATQGSALADRRRGFGTRLRGGKSEPSPLRQPDQ